MVQRGGLLGFARNARHQAIRRWGERKICSRATDLRLRREHSQSAGNTPTGFPDKRGPPAKEFRRELISTIHSHCVRNLCRRKETRNSAVVFCSTGSAIGPGS